MDKNDYATNPSQRTPCVLVLDASSSMETLERNGLSRIDMLNQGITAFYDALKSDEIALSRVQIAAVIVGGPSDKPELMLDWTDAEYFQPFKLYANGSTPLGEGTKIALECIEEQKSRLRTHGINYTRPWMVILTDGEPTDSNEVWAAACSRVKLAEAANKVLVYPIVIGDINTSKLSDISQTPIKQMDTIKFKELFVWLSASLGQISRSAPGQSVSLQPVDPWATVKL
jgi:uncharacterized protein YegL